MPSRRTLLASAVAPSVPGCLDSLGAGDEPAAPTTNGTAVGDGGGVPSSRGPVRGESDADLAVREVEDDGDVEYLPDEGAIRYVAGHRYVDPPDERMDDEPPEEDDEPPEKEPVYETTPAEQLAETKCLHAAAGAAAEHANDRLDADGGGLDTDAFGVGTTRDGEGHDRGAAISITTVLDRDGGVVSEPPVAFEALVQATPRTVAATYELGEGFEYTLDAPVYARYSVVRQA